MSFTQTLCQRHKTDYVQNQHTNDETTNDETTNDDTTNDIKCNYCTNTTTIKRSQTMTLTTQSTNNTCDNGIDNKNRKTHVKVR